MIYPWINMKMEFPSVEENAAGYVLTKRELHWYADQMFTDETDRDDPRADLLASADLSQVAPTLVTTCRFDPLRDEGRAYAALLGEAGVTVDHVEYDDMVHGYLFFPATFRRGTDPFEDIAAFIDAHVPAMGAA
jgi:acetyl esterase